MPAWCQMVAGVRVPFRFGDDAETEIRAKYG